MDMYTTLMVGHELQARASRGRSFKKFKIYNLLRFMKVHFFKFDYTKDLSFYLEYIENTEFKNTYFQISYLKFVGEVQTLKDIHLLKYFTFNCLDYNSQKIGKIFDFKDLFFFPNSEITSNIIIFEIDRIFSFSNKLEAINFLIKNLSKFPNSVYKNYSHLPNIKPVKKDNEISRIKIETYISTNNKIGWIKLIGTYPYKGSLEANYISNMLDVFPELKPIEYLIIDVSKFYLEYDWDNDLYDLKPTNSKFNKIKIYYLDKEKRDFMSEHDNLFLGDIDDIIKIIG